MSPLTRRSLLGAMTVFGTVGPAFAQTTGTRIVSPAEEEPTTLDAWVDRYGRPTAKVILNGSTTLKFMVDTGSTTTVIAQRHILKLGAPISGIATVNGTTGTAQASLAKIDSLETGAVRKSDIRVAVLPDAGLGVDGILGADVFAGRRLVFDIQQRIVRVENSRRQTRTAPRHNMRVRNGLLAEIDGRIGTVDTCMMLDTGAEHSIANLKLQQALAKAHPRMSVVRNVSIVGVTGHELIGDYMQLPRIDFGSFQVKDAGAVAADAPIFKVWELNEEPAMIVGVDVLSRFGGFSIDYGARMFEASPLALIARGGGMMG